jgi:hypothetical protein
MSFNYIKFETTRSIRSDLELSHGKPDVYKPNACDNKGSAIRTDFLSVMRKMGIFLIQLSHGYLGLNIFYYHRFHGSDDYRLRDFKKTDLLCYLLLVKSHYILSKYLIYFSLEKSDR